MQLLLLTLAFASCISGYSPPEFWKENVDSDEQGTFDHEDFMEMIKERISSKTMDLLKEGMPGVDIEERFQKLRNFASSHRIANLTEEQEEEIHESVANMENIVTEKPPGTNATDLFEINQLNGISDFLFQGDIHLTDEQLEQMDNLIEGDSENSGDRQKRAASSAFKKWTNGVVYYYLDPSVANNAVKVASLKAAFQYIEARTCIRFKKSTSAKNRIKVFSGAGCYSGIGMNGGEQELSFGDGCEVMGIIAHEVTHALGFWHTHMRSDRDSYVTIDTSAVDGADTAFNFDKLKSSQNILYTPYEYGSFMHYGADSFARKGQYSIIPKDQKYWYTIGNNMFTFYDIKMKNDHYNCSAKCPAATSAKCQNGGVPNPNNCAICNCPLGYAGALCDQMPPVSGGCGGELTATIAWQSKSFQYGEDTRTERNVPTECHHWIKAPTGSKIQVRITNMSNTQCNFGCQFQGIEFKLSNPQMTNPRICCDAFQNIVYTSDLNPLPVIAFNRYFITTFTIEYRIYQAETGAPLSTTITARPNVRTTRARRKTTTTTPRPNIRTTRARRTTTTTAFVSSVNCVDYAPNCASLVRQGFCTSRQHHFQVKKYNCAQSCNLCGKRASPCIDLEGRDCHFFRATGHCSGLPPLQAEYHCAATCGFCAYPN